jgi:hypothetical protein
VSMNGNLIENRCVVVVSLSFSGAPRRDCKAPLKRWESEGGSSEVARHINS